MSHHERDRDDVERLPLAILPQPDDSTCGPTCLQALYAYHGDHQPLEAVVERVGQIEGGGTIEVLLALDALARGYRATIHTFNLHVFDPTWFAPDAPPLADRLRAQVRARRSAKLRMTCEAYIEFLERGGRVRLDDLTRTLVRRPLQRGIPVLTGLSATWLYRDARELVQDGRLVRDDVRGTTQGHFVVLCGYDRGDRTVDVADPLLPNPVSASHHYRVDIDRLVCAILLGMVTYDASLLVVEPPRRRDGHPRRRRAP